MENYAEVRSALEQSITEGSAPAPGMPRIEPPTYELEHPIDPKTAFDPLRRYCTGHQRQMESIIRSLRAQLRGMLDKGDTQHRQLAVAGLCAIAVATAAFTVLLGARPRDAGWIAVACGLSYGAALLGAHALGAELGAFVAAATVGVASNLFARGLRRPATLLRLPGLLLLVPGSLGFRSLSSLLAADTIAGTDGLFRAALVTVALAVGLFAADLLLPPQRTL